VTPNSSFTPWQRTLLSWGGLVLAIASLYWGRAVLVPVVLAVLLAFILQPAVRTLERARLGRVFSTLLAVFIAISVLTGIGWLVAGQFQDLAKKLPDHKNTIVQKLNGLMGTEEGVSGGLMRFVKDVSDELQIKGPGGGSGPPDEQQRGKKGREELQSNEPGAVPDAGPKRPVPVVLTGEGPLSFGWFTALFGPVLDAVVTAILVTVLVVFMLIMREDLRNRVIRLVGKRQVTSTTRATDDAAQRISHFLLMQLVVNFGFGVALSLGLLAIGIPYPFLWGLLGCLMRFIPFLGIWVVAALLALFNLAVFPGWTPLLLTFVLFIALELLAANVIELLVFGHGTGVTPIALLVAAAFWTWLWGPIGLLLSTPMTVCLVVLGKYVPQLEFFSILLSNEAGLDPEVGYYQRLLAHDQDEAIDLVEEFLNGHPPDEVYDEVLVPALVLAKRDRQREELTPEDEQWVRQVTRQVLQDYIPLYREKSGEASGAGNQKQERAVLVLGCSAEDGEDELALEMVRQLLEPSACRFETIPSKALVAEVVERVRSERPSVLVVGSLPPGGLAQTRYLCKRLRLRFPDLKIIVGRWGGPDGTDRTRAHLNEAGADLVLTTLLETRAQLAPLIQALSHTSPKPELAAVP
jgi:predicted PurR-regulated permease PerM